MAPLPGGILPAIDGNRIFEPHPDGDRYACQRCRKILDQGRDG